MIGVAKEKHQSILRSVSIRLDCLKENWLRKFSMFISGVARGAIGQLPSTQNFITQGFLEMMVIAQD